MSLQGDPQVSPENSISRQMPHHTQTWTLSDTDFIQDWNVTCHPDVYYYGRVFPFLRDIFLNSCLLHPQSDPLAPLRFRPSWQYTSKLVTFNSHEQEGQQLGCAKPKSGINYKVLGLTQKQNYLLVCSYIWSLLCLLTEKQRATASILFH